MGAVFLIQLQVATERPNNQGGQEVDIRGRENTTVGNKRKSLTAQIEVCRVPLSIFHFSDFHQSPDSRL